MNWYTVIYESETGLAHVNLFDDIGCCDKTSGDLERELDALSPKKISLQIDSSGGNSITGLNLYSIFGRYPTDVLITGSCCSAAVPAALAGQPIRIHPSARMLIHSPVCYCHGGADELFAAAVEVEKLRGAVAKILCARTRQPAPVVADWLSRDTWFTAAEAVELGLADEIAVIPPPRPVPPAMAKTSPAGKLVIPPAAVIPESEQFFTQWLTAFGRVEVLNREKFICALVNWAHTNTDQPSNP